VPPSASPSESESAATVLEVQAPIRAAAESRRGVNWMLVAFATSLLLLVSAAVGGVLVARTRRRAA
jgi:hypothetical protein